MNLTTSTLSTDSSVTLGMTTLAAYQPVLRPSRVSAVHAVIQLPLEVVLKAEDKATVFVLDL
eukprot:6209727-Pleurochrysis_carterae.AAC.2